jgi:hypothetical protein
MLTTTTLAEVLETLSLTDADEVDVIEEMAMAVVRKGTAQVVVYRRDEDEPGSFGVAFHAHESEEDARSCHAWKVGTIRNPIGAMLSQMFGRAFDTSPGEDTGYYL